jgi:prepilin-type N-terminal cleavage/methylation domain-containing protein
LLNFTSIFDNFTLILFNINRQAVMTMTQRGSVMKNWTHQDQQGFSLVEVLVVAGIMGVLALGIAQMFTNQAKQQKNAQVKANALQVQMAIQSAASDPAAILRSSIR